MSKHAPGPWELTHTEHVGFRVSDSTGWGVAVVLKDTNDEANAHLMAAAPQMLEALEELEPFLQWLVIEQGDKVDKLLKNKILPAIKAAKGKV